MRLRAVHIFVLLAVVAGLSGCGRKARVIPEKKLVRIYSDMFLADQWVRDHVEARTVADTTLFFDPIFKRYGYDFEDYDASLNYYVDHPIEFAEILTKASDRLRARSDALQAELTEQRQWEEKLDSFRRLYHPKDFSDDSLRWTATGILWPVEAEAAEVDSLKEEPGLFEPERVVTEPEGSDTWEEVKPLDRDKLPRPTRIRVEDRDKEQETVE